MFFDRLIARRRRRSAARAARPALEAMERPGPARMDVRPGLIGYSRDVRRARGSHGASGSGGVRGGAAVMVKQVDVGAIGSYFESLSDPRHARNRKHLLVDVAVVAVCGVLCGCDGPTAVHRWAAVRREWLERHLAVPNGVPSRDCIRRLLMALRPEAFQRCFQAWLADVQDADATGDEKVDGRLVAIDGKTCRGSNDPSKGLGALHVVSAWASEEGIALGQVATAEKSNEITPIPQLLDRIQLPGTLVTIDAMGCQKEIVEKVVEGGGDCVIAVKDNQPKLLEAVRKALFDANARSCSTASTRRSRKAAAGSTSARIC